MEYYQSLPQIKQDTPEWYQRRSEIITSTNVASILHLNSFHSYDELLSKQPDPTPHTNRTITSQNVHNIQATEWGKLLEPFAIQHLEQTTHKAVGSLGLKVHDEIPYLGASPDGIQIVNGVARLIEIKCPVSRQITYKVPLEYWVQMQIAMEVWDIDRVLYCEYKFNLSTERPSTQDLTLTYGSLENGVYWNYVDNWQYEITRDRAWFQEIKPQIESFYKLKFTPIFNPDITTRTAITTNPNTGSTKVQSSTIKRKRDNEVSEEDQQRSKMRSSKYMIKERVPVNRFDNFLQDDPILDWLEFHAGKHKWTRRKDMFISALSQLGLEFRLDVINSMIDVANEKGVNYCILNPSINNLLSIYKNNLLLKLPYDLNVLEETQQMMDKGMGIIFMGQLSRKINKHYLWDTFEMIIRKDVFKMIFTDVLFEGAPILEELDYIPMKLKYTTLDYRANSSFLKSKHKLDMTKMGLISTSLIFDRHGQHGVIPKHNNVDVFKNGLAWFKEIETTQLKDLYPNMNNDRDGQWRHAKNEIAESIEELTQISYMNYENREELHSQGITKISQLLPEHLEGLKNAKQIGQHISKELYLPPLPVPEETPEMEIFMDFESVSSIFADEGLIFMMGVILKPRDGDSEYCKFIVDNLEKVSEKKMLNEGFKYIKSKTRGMTNVPIYHWGNAERSLLKTAEKEVPSNMYMIDLHNHFKNEGATIPGCYGFGLKDVANTLHNMGLVQSIWLNDINGSMAMVMAHHIQHKCAITGGEFKEDPRIVKISEYNYVDCQVLLEIRQLL